MNPNQQQQYYTNPPTSSFSTNSENDVINAYTGPVASNWLNQGTNATPYQQQNPYTQQQTYFSSQDYQTPSYNNAYKQQNMDTQSGQSDTRTFTSRSNRSKKSSHESRAQSRTSEIISEALRDDVNQLTPQLEAAYEAATGKRRSPVIKRQVITMPGQAGRVQQVVRRLPTPTPDVIERIFIVKPQRDTINLIIERPCTPPVQYKDKTIYGKSRRPIINPKIVSVQPGHYYPQLESAPYQNQLQFQNQQAIQDQVAPVGYLLAPVRVNEGNNTVQTMAMMGQQNVMNEMQMPTSSVMQTYTAQNAQNVQNQQNLSHAPTFSTNVLQPYNPPMFDQYQQQMGAFQGYQGGYPNQFGQQQF